jgi:hypothetical protein
MTCNVEEDTACTLALQIFLPSLLGGVRRFNTLSIPVWNHNHHQNNVPNRHQHCSKEAVTKRYLYARAVRAKKKKKQKKKKKCQPRTTSQHATTSPIARTLLPE